MCLIDRLKGEDEFQGILGRLSWDSGIDDLEEVAEDLESILAHANDAIAIADGSVELEALKDMKNQATKGISLIATIDLILNELAETLGDLLTAAEPFKNWG